LVVVPLTTLSNWMLEFDEWAPSIKKVIYKGSPQNRKQCALTLRTTRWNVCITTYEYILKDRLVLNKFNWQYIIIDEGHRMKNSKSKFALTLGQEYNSENRLLLTGTPLQNNLGELWSLLNFLLPKVFNSCDEFEKWFSLAVSKDTGDKDTQLTEEEQLLIINRLHQVLRPFLLRRIKSEVAAEIPNKQEDVIKVELSPWQKIVYDQINDNSAIMKDESGQVAKKSLMNLMMQLRKICDHPYLFLNSSSYINDINDNIFRSSGKFELLDRILPKLFAFKHRVLIFCQMTHVMDIMELYFEYKDFNISDWMVQPRLMKEVNVSLFSINLTLNIIFSYSVLELVVLVSIFKLLILLSCLIQIGILKWIFKLKIELIESVLKLKLE